MSIDELRNEINSVDERLVELFEKRMALSGKIAEYKKENGIPVFDEKREKEIIEKLSAQSDGQMQEYVVALYEKIFELSRSYQEKLVNTGE